MPLTIRKKPKPASQAPEASENPHAKSDATPAAPLTGILPVVPAPKSQPTLSANKHLQRSRPTGFSQDFFTINQLAARWEVTPRHARSFIDAGALKVMRLGKSVRIAAHEVALFEATQGL